MKYMGSKSRIAKHIVPIIQEKIAKSGYKSYIEPFVGGANIIDKIKSEYKVGFDINPYLIALLRHVQAGGALPETITPEEYKKIREKKIEYEPWKVGCAGFLASYNGKFFGGYAGIVHTKAGTVRNYYDEARRNLIKQADTFKTIDFARFDYKNLGFSNCVIYCDPPYAGTTGYEEAQFNHSDFWEIMRKWSENNIVIISEETAPEDFICIWEAGVTRTQDNTSRKAAVEKLFIFGEGEAVN